MTSEQLAIAGCAGACAVALGLLLLVQGRRARNDLRLLQARRRLAHAYLEKFHPGCELHNLNEIGIAFAITPGSKSSAVATWDALEASLVTGTDVRGRWPT